MSAKVLTNLEAIGEMIGALEGIAEGLEKDEYMEDLIAAAHRETTHYFDVAAAATGSAGHLPHVFEFGTAGITRGPIKFPNPTAPEARLWMHTLTGQGGNQDIGYTFRPALNRNPQPTTRDTGVPSKYLRKLSKRKYIFRNKAYVMETGMEVEIRAKNGTYLFVPFNNEPGRNPLNRRGFVMWNSSKLGPIKAVPGKATKGTFTAFWMRWWGSAGQEILEQNMYKEVSKDLEIAQKQAAAAAEIAEKKMKYAASSNPMSVAKRAKFTSEKRFGDM